MQKAIIVLGALAAGAILVAGEAFARPGGFGGGGGRAGGFGGGTRGGYHGSMGGIRGGMIGHGGFRGAATRFGPGWSGRGYLGPGFRGTAMRIHPGWKGRGHIGPGFRHYGRDWRGYHHRYGYRKYHPYYYGGALSAGLLAASYGYDYPYSYAASPYYGAYPSYGYDGSEYEQSCPLLIRRVVGPKGRVVVRRQYLCR